MVAGLFLGTMRWLYHATSESLCADGSVAPASLQREGFIHASFQPDVLESARLYLPAGASHRVLQIDPRRLDVPVAVVTTPRGPMPHIHGRIPADAVRAVLPLADVSNAPDALTGTRVAFVAFHGMTLLDLVGAWDPVSRLASMGFDPGASAEIVSADGVIPWQTPGAALTVSPERVRPGLTPYDVLVVPGGHGVRPLIENATVMAWLSTWPANRMTASVCTGALVLGAMGRLKGKHATTHHTALDQLARWGAVVESRRVVDAGHVITGGGVTAALDLGLHLVRRLAGHAVAEAIATQMAMHVAPKDMESV